MNSLERLFHREKNMSGSSTVYGGHGPAGDVSFNYTPLVDVTFNLIIFFVLTSQIVGTNLAKIDLAQPNTSLVVLREDPSVAAKQRIIIQVVSKRAGKKDDNAQDRKEASEAACYEIDGQSIPLNNQQLLESKITQTVNFLKRENKLKSADDFYVEVRADKRVQYSYVAPVLKAAVNANIKNMNITALAEK